jgi:hypothetical protein
LVRTNSILEPKEGLDSGSRYASFQRRLEAEQELDAWTSSEEPINPADVREKTDNPPFFLTGRGAFTIPTSSPSCWGQTSSSTSQSISTFQSGYGQQPTSRQYDPPYETGQYDPSYETGQCDPSFEAGQYDQSFDTTEYDQSFDTG